MRLEDVKHTLAANVTKLLSTRPDARIELAKRIGVGDGTLGRIVYGTGNPTIEVIANIAKFFHVEPWELLRPATEPSPTKVRDEPPVDEARLAKAVDELTRLLDSENLALPKPLFARAVSLIYSLHGRDNRASIRTKVLQLIKNSA